MNFLIFAYKKICQIIAPPFCVACRVYLDDHVVAPLYLCAPCVKSIKPVITVNLTITQSKNMQVYAVGAYEPPLSTLIFAKSSSLRIIIRQLAHLMAIYAPKNAFNHCDIILPIPLHWRKYISRGFNQSHEIALVLGEMLKKPVVLAVHKKIFTKNQTDLSGSERADNLADVFELTDPESVRNKHVLIVDDVMTTGATLREVARTILAANPASLTALVAARVVR